MSRPRSIYIASMWSSFYFHIHFNVIDRRNTDALVLLLIFQNMSYCLCLVTRMQNVTNFQIAKFNLRVMFSIWAAQTHSDAINLKKTFVFICRQNINFTPNVFLEILQRYANFLFWVLWAKLVSHTQNRSINL